jgi:hypothetical protein
MILYQINRIREVLNLTWQCHFLLVGFCWVGEGAREKEGRERGSPYREGGTDGGRVQSVYVGVYLGGYKVDRSTLPDILDQTQSGKFSCQTGGVTD